MGKNPEKATAYARVGEDRNSNLSDFGDMLLVKQLAGVKLRFHIQSRWSVWHGGFQELENRVTLLSGDLLLLLKNCNADFIAGFRSIRVDINKLLRRRGFADIHNSAIPTGMFVGEIGWISS
ncbi:MAG: hypothetical protein NTW52_18105 [Planctomycetota bacterium]|nr:hypothetical protein [Planctomycetota bacterium]